MLASVLFHCWVFQGCGTTGKEGGGRREEGRDEKERRREVERKGER